MVLGMHQMSNQFEQDSMGTHREIFSPEINIESDVIQQPIMSTRQENFVSQADDEIHLTESLKHLPETNGHDLAAHNTKVIEANGPNEINSSEEQKSEGLEDQHSADLPEDLPISSSIIQRKMEESKLMSPTTIS